MLIIKKMGPYFYLFFDKIVFLLKPSFPMALFSGVNRNKLPLYLYKISRTELFFSLLLFMIRNFGREKKGRKRGENKMERVKRGRKICLDDYFKSRKGIGKQISKVTKFSDRCNKWNPRLNVSPKKGTKKRARILWDFSRYKWRISKWNGRIQLFEAVDFFIIIHTT